ncbi:acyl-CoA dehydrogenase [Rhizocola hellebori]|uniref:Acyl-CoA dehydrogenase n=1 Tax=Rhizocola hellebori TaxID=1392758 RepID=A0A8J3QJA6_9ACTN|nr:acyl-CoA dehydrogenase family protein [Rhizocola hellebori]GIH10418.1 acyl-CoA dehydrogenase [Rhizocola hellebori]
MHFAHDDLPLLDTLQDFMKSHVFPAEKVLEEQLETIPLWTTAPIVQELKAAARERGLWNLFRDLPNLEYARVAEVSGWSPHLAPEAMNCAAPDTGNMEVISQFGTEAQKEQWLKPLLEGEIRSAFCMTEPEVASSDASNITTSIRREGDEYVIDGRKWFASGAMNPNCKIFIVMGKSDPDADRHRQQSMILVPRDTPGIDVKRSMHVFGFNDGHHGGHAEIIFSGVRVPASNMIANEGDGFAIAQARLGPGRIHHCMRLIGMAERALSLMCQRAQSRIAFGKPVAQQGVVMDWIAESRVRIEQARLLVLKTAWLMDTVGNKGAHTEIQAIKIAVPLMAEWVLDKAIQVHGGGGVSQEFPLSSLWAAARTLRLADGPDEVHKMSLARRELKQYQS